MSTVKYGATKRTKSVLTGAVAALLSVGCISGANAALLDAPVPGNAFITQGGLDWAWAMPLPGPLDLSFQGPLGWRVPTAGELALAPLATDFLFAGANVPFNGVDPVSLALFQATNQPDYINAASAGACAAPYFNGTYFHCDWQDGLGQQFGPWAGMVNAQSFADALVVRNAVPEPATLALLGIALAGLGFSRRKLY